MKIKATAAELDKLELQGLSEAQIANDLNCSRMALYNYRKRINHPQIMRSDKGVERKTAEEKRLTRNKYRRNYPAKTRNGRQLRKIALQTLGRRLKKGEVIHHLTNLIKRTKLMTFFNVKETPPPCDKGGVDVFGTPHKLHNNFLVRGW